MFYCSSLLKIPEHAINRWGNDLFETDINVTINNFDSIISFALNNISVYNVFLIDLNSFNTSVFAQN